MPMKNDRGYTRTSSFASRGSAGRKPMQNWVSGYTLIELVVAVGLFSVVMLLASGAYLVMIGISRQAQGIATGIDNVSFALEVMTRDIRTGSDYCGSDLVGICTDTSFSFRNEDMQETTYALGTQQGASGTVGAVMQNGLPLTDASVDITSLTFYPFGTAPNAIGNDVAQSRVTVLISGSVSTSANKTPQHFTVETLATMRQSDL